MVTPRTNKLLGHLPDDSYERIQPDLKLVSWLTGQELHGPGEPIDKVYFPVTALVCLSKELPQGASMDTALIGPESMVGLRGLVGPSAHRVYVGAAGLAYQLPIAVLKQTLLTDLGLRKLCWETADRLSKMMVAEATCSRFHATHQRVAKWLLMRLDRQVPHAIEATHQTIANALGVRREAVSIALASMPGVTVRRGSVEVVDRARLEGACCDCYFSE